MLLTCVQLLVTGSHASVVQALLSLHFGWPMHVAPPGIGAMHWSGSVHFWLSSHAVAGRSGTLTHCDAWNGLHVWKMQLETAPAAPRP